MGNVSVQREEGLKVKDFVGQTLPFSKTPFVDTSVVVAASPTCCGSWKAAVVPVDVAVPGVVNTFAW